MRAVHPDILHELFTRTGDPSQRNLDSLIIDRHLPIAALCNDPDGQGFAIGVARIEKAGRCFEFLEDGVRAVIILARDEDGEPIDLVAWLPNEGWFAPWLGTVPLLGMQELAAPRLNTPLPVYLEPGGWLRGGREGVTILDRKRAWLPLEGVTIAAASVEHGVELRRILDRPKPRIVVSSAPERIAA